MAAATALAPGIGSTLKPGVANRRNQCGTGIRNPRRAGVGHQRDRLALRKLRDDSFDTRRSLCSCTLRIGVSMS